MTISILIGLYIGLFNEADRFLGVSRTIAFFPFFLLGYYADKNRIQNLRNRNKLYAFVLLTICLVLVFILSDHNIPIKALENIQSYQTSGMTDMAIPGQERTAVYLGRKNDYCIYSVGLSSKDHLFYTDTSIFIKSGPRKHYFNNWSVSHFNHSNRLSGIIKNRCNGLPEIN